MIERRASEIIRLALTMSQINNTDALSWRNKIDMLNQSYVRLYDDLNNAGDLYFVKEIDLSEPAEPGCYRLPDDFWKLLLAGRKSSFGEVIPIERAPNVGQYFSGYRIINNTIVFNNRWSFPGPLVLRYLPMPKTITYPRPGERIPGKAAQAGYDSVADVVVYDEFGKLTVINNSESNRASINIEGTFILAVSAGIIYVVQQDGITCYDYELNEVSLFLGVFDLYAHAIGWEEGIICIQDGVTKKYISGAAPEDSQDYWNYINGKIAQTQSAGTTGFIYTDADDRAHDLTELFIGSDSFVIADPFIYINKAGNEIVYNELRKTDLSPAVIGGGKRKGLVLAAEVNNDSGFGVVYRDFYSGLHLLGFANDTVMNYPQNIFFDWLIADLAVKFRIACDIPTNELPALADDYKDTLMKGLSRDAYMNPRISNVYGRAYL